MNKANIISRYSIGEPSKKFKKEFNKLIRKFHINKRELELQIEELLLNPNIHTPIAGHPKLLKLDVPIPGVSGKRTGLRIIFYQDHENKTLFPVTTYFKSDKSDLTKKELDIIENEYEII